MAGPVTWTGTISESTLLVKGRKPSCTTTSGDFAGPIVSFLPTLRFGIVKTVGHRSCIHSRRKIREGQCEMCIMEGHFAPLKSEAPSDWSKKRLTASEGTPFFSLSAAWILERVIWRTAWRAGEPWTRICFMTKIATWLSLKASCLMPGRHLPFP